MTSGSIFHGHHTWCPVSMGGHSSDLPLFLNVSFFFILFLFGYAGSCCCAGSFLVAASRAYALVVCAVFSLGWLPLLLGLGSRAHGLSSCSAWA